MDAPFASNAAGGDFEVLLKVHRFGYFFLGGGSFRNKVNLKKNKSLQTKKKKCVQDGEILALLPHSHKACKSQLWPRLNPGAGSPILVSHLGSKDPSTWTCCLPGGRSQDSTRRWQAVSFGLFPPPFRFSH